MALLFSNAIFGRAVEQIIYDNNVGYRMVGWRYLV